MKVLELGPDETDLRGRWIERGGRTIGDDACERIKALTADVLERLGADPTGWDTLFRDPRDNRLWERTYPHSEYHGGGPPRLTLISPADAAAKYHLPLA